MAEDKDKLKNKRRGAKSLFTKKLSTLESFITANRPNQQVIGALEDFKLQYGKILSIHEEYGMLLSDAEFDAEEAWLDDVVASANRVLSLATDYLNKSVIEPNIQATGNNSVGGTAVLQTQNPDEQQRDNGQNPNNAENTTPSQALSKLSIKQEKLTVITFDGSDVLDYFDFRDDFGYAIGSKYSALDARYILDRFVKGRAKEWIQGERDIEECWKTLDSVYGDPRLVSDTLTKRIQKFPNLAENDTKFEQLFHLLKKARSILGRLKRSQDLDNSTMISTIERKLATSDRVKWAEKQKQDGVEPSISGLLQWVQDQIWVRQVAGVEKSNSRLVGGIMDSEPGDAESEVPGTPQLNGMMNYSGGGTSMEYNAKCWCCKNSHWIQNCEQFKKLSPNERLDKVREVGACYNCLRIHRGKCFYKRPCSSKECKFNHHNLLHGASFFVEGFSVEAPENAENNSGTSLNANVVSQCKSDQQSLLPIISVKCLAIDQTVCKGNVLFDTGSQLTLVQEGFARNLGLHGEPKSLQITKVGGQVDVIPSMVYRIHLIGNDGLRYTVSASSVPKIADVVESISLEECAEKFGLESSALSRGDGPLHLLIGIDNPQFHTGKITLKDDLAIRESVLGNVVFGRGFTGENSTDKGITAFQEVSVAHPVDLTQFWSTEQMGVALNDCCKVGVGKTLSPIEQQEYDQIRSSARKVGDRWLIPYPWAKNPNDLPDNYSQAMAKLRNTETRLAKIPEAAKQYQSQIDDLVQRGCARKLSQEEIRNYEGPVHYNSHHMVVRLDKTSTPYRLVFNPAEKFKGVALNDFFIKGPDLLNTISSVLIRFRENQVAFVGDIKKMYHQVLVDSTIDSHVCRFLWRDLDSSRPPDVYMTEVVTFGIKPAPALANVAIDLTVESEEGEFPEACEIIKNSRYMDDIADSCTDQAHVKDLTKDIESVLKTSHFEIKQWSTNEIVKSEDPNQVSEEKVLGIFWDRQSDKLRLVIKPAKKLAAGPDGEWLPLDTVQLTKRVILSVIAGIYDVFGFATPVTIIGKIGLQSIWKLNLDWDEKFSPEISTFWQKWLADVKVLTKFEIPRCLTPVKKVGNPTLVVFTDASEQAFGAVAYCRWALTDGTFETRFFIAKSRVAPLKAKLTIPRLELQGLVIGARLIRTIKQESRLNWENIFLFCDSKVALAWVQNDDRTYKPFVTARVSEVRGVVQSENLHYCDTATNVADDLSRGLSSNQLQGRWLQGPEFLKLPVQHWPSTENELGSEDQEIVASEIKKSSLVGKVSEAAHLLSPWEGMKKYSNMTKAIHVAAWFNRAVNNFSPRTEKIKSKLLSPEEINQAEIILIRHCQVGMKLEELKSLTPIKDYHGIIRVGGRVDKINLLSYETKHPVILDKNSWLSKLVISHYHNQGHTGVLTTVAKSRRKFWIVGAQKLAKSIKFQCVICRILDKMTATQVMADLPPERLLMGTPPFHAVAIDLFGPILARFGLRKNVKIWGVLIVCLNTGALYGDIVQDYTSNSLWMTLRRFFSIRGKPSIIYSDHGSNLEGLSREMKRDMQEYSSSEAIQWKFVTEKAAHQNGCVEAMVKTTKRTLHQTLGEKTMYPIEVQTLLFEAVQIVNQRPIGKVSQDPEDLQFLCPNDLLLGRASAEIPQGPFLEPCKLKQRHEMVQQLLTSWWDRWYKQVFPTLIPRKKWQDQKRDFKVGDFVLIKDPNPLRSEWTRGIVLKVFPGKDGRIRNVKVKTQNGELQRPITLIALILPVDGFEN